VSERSNYFRGGEKYDTRATGMAITKVADMLDAADNRVPTSVYPEIYGIEDVHTVALAWSWAALLLADMAEIDSSTLRQLANAINGIYDE
jgi:hypothetical protein